MDFIRHIIYDYYLLYFQCFIFLDDAQGVADILEKLIKDNEASVMKCYYLGDKNMRINLNKKIIGYAYSPVPIYF